MKLSSRALGVCANQQSICQNKDSIPCYSRGSYKGKGRTSMFKLRQQSTFLGSILLNFTLYLEDKIKAKISVLFLNLVLKFQHWYVRKEDMQKLAAQQLPIVIYLIYC